MACTAVASDETDSPPPEWPCDVKSYSLERCIGHGAFARVYTAVAKGAQKQRVAIKIMDLDQVTTDINDIMKEVQMMRMCSHENVLSCHASFVSKSDLYLVMPLMEKGSCLHIMQYSKERGWGEGLAEDWLGYVLTQVLQGLEYLHANGHIHRDVKAGNILLNPAGKVALADFGVSSWLVQGGHRKRTAKTFVGTPCWMAPEVMEQVDGYDYKADIWSVGITALELGKGFAPYAFLPPMKVLMLTIQEEPPSLRSYPTEKSCTGESFSRSFKEMVRMCLQKESRKRPTVQTLLNSKFFKTPRSKEPFVEQLLSKIEDVTATQDDEGCAAGNGGTGGASSTRRRGSKSVRTASTFGGDAPLEEEEDDDVEDDFEEHPDEDEEEQQQGDAQVTPRAHAESEEYVQGTTWTFDDGEEVVLKSESYIRREIDARSAQDQIECEAIFEDVENLMNRRGGEWDFKKNQDVQSTSVDDDANGASSTVS